MDFENDGYKVIRNALHPEVVEYYKNETKLLEEELNNELKNKNIDKKYYYNDSLVEKALCRYGATFTESLLLHLKPLIELTVNKELYPTYSYLRIYYNGATLKKHKDRSSCEYSISVCIKNDKEPWDLYFESNDVITQIKLFEGDLVIYKGCEVPHWRNRYVGNEHIQFFLHYVDKNGKYADFKYDKRENI